MSHDKVPRKWRGEFHTIFIFFFHFLIFPFNIFLCLCFLYFHIFLISVFFFHIFYFHSFLYYYNYIKTLLTSHHEDFPLVNLFAPRLIAYVSLICAHLLLCTRLFRLLLSFPWPSLTHQGDLIAGIKISRRVCPPSSQVSFKRRRWGGKKGTRKDRIDSFRSLGESLQNLPLRSCRN